MDRLRNVLQNLIFIPTVIVSSVACAFLVIIVNFFSKKSPLLKKIELIWAKSIVWASGIHIILKGALPEKDRCYIFISNHFSHLDTPIIMSILKDFSPRFIAKDSLFKIPIFGQGMKAAGHIPIHRENKRQALKDLNNAVNTLKQGESVLLFPEGTRNNYKDRLLDFQVGPFILAIKLGMEMVPITIYGTNECLPRGSVFIKPSKVYVWIHKPIEWPKEFSLKKRDDLKNKTKDFMENKYVELTKWIKETE